MKRYLARKRRPLLHRHSTEESTSSPAGVRKATTNRRRGGRRYDDPNLVAIGLVGEGRALLKQGRVADGMALLDEAMVCALSDGLHPVWVGAVYCHLMDACHDVG